MTSMQSEVSSLKAQLAARNEAAARLEVRMDATQLQLARIEHSIDQLVSVMSGMPNMPSGLGPLIRH